MSKAPIWRMYPNLNELSRLTGYRVSYLERCKKGAADYAPEGFKRRVAAALGKTEVALFGEEQEVSQK